MTQGLTGKRSTLFGEARSLVSNPPWHGLALAAVLVLSAFLNLWGLMGEGYYGHRHYLVMLAPAIAALVGTGAMVLWKDYRSPGWRGWLLPLTLVEMAGVQAYVLVDYAVWLAGQLNPFAFGYHPSQGKLDLKDGSGPREKQVG